MSAREARVVDELASTDLDAVMRIALSPPSKRKRPNTCTLKRSPTACRLLSVSSRYGGSFFAIALVMLRSCLPVVNACRPACIVEPVGHQRAAPIRVAFGPYRTFNPVAFADAVSV